MAQGIPDGRSADLDDGLLAGIGAKWGGNQYFGRQGCSFLNGYDLSVWELRGNFDRFIFKVLDFLLALQQERMSQHGMPMFNAGYHIRTASPMCLGKIGRRPPRGMIGMRMIKAYNVVASQLRLTLNAYEFRRADLIAIRR
jgi:hypothetical protein